MRDEELRTIESDDELAAVEGGRCKGDIHIAYEYQMPSYNSYWFDPTEPPML